jgi:hypothetical protein
VRNAENEYPVPDPNRTIIHMTNDIHKNSLKEEIMNDLIKILMEKLQEKVKQNVQDVLKQYQGTTNKKHEKVVYSHHSPSTQYLKCQPKQVKKQKEIQRIQIGKKEVKLPLFEDARRSLNFYFCNMFLAIVHLL